MANDVPICQRCSDNFVVSVKYIQCKNCVKQYHPSCVNIKDAFNKFINECDNLFWFCDDCKGEWQLKSCSVSDSSPSNIGEKLNTESLILKKEVECLKREKDLLNKLLCELEYSNKLLKSQISASERDVNAEQNVSQTVLLSDQNSTTINNTNTYSNVLKKSPNTKSAVLIIKSNDDSVSNEDVVKNVTQSVNPANLNICINGTRKIKNGVAVYCENELSLNTLKNSLDNKLGSQYSINEARKLNPRLLVKNVKLNEDLNSDAEIITNILSQNDLGEFKSSDFKIITKLKYFNNYNIVIEVPSILRKLLITREYLWLGWKKCTVGDHLRILQCFKCSGFGHTEKQCKSEVSCVNCASDHTVKNCKAEESKCVNCVNYNKRHKFNLSVKHSAKDSCCPVYKNYVEKFKVRINYD